jgi:flagellar hook-basal body complex protein FliE
MPFVVATTTKASSSLSMVVTSVLTVSVSADQKASTSLMFAKKIVEKLVEHTSLIWAKNGGFPQMI